jgi:uncharacterized membrane protein
VPAAVAWHKDVRLWAILSAAAFSLKAIFVKLAYGAYPVDAVTLLTLRMLFALPAFLLLSRGALGNLGWSRRTWGGLIGLGVIFQPVRLSRAANHFCWSGTPDPLHLSDLRRSA